MAAVLFDGELYVHYGFVHVQPPEAEPDLVAARGGQVNGLCGAAQPGVLSLVTGLHTGRVPLLVECPDGEPELEPDWEEAVEASLTTADTTLRLVSFDDGAELTLPAPGTYRVRFCAAGMDAARERDVRMDGELPPDRYRLQLWPAPAGPDAVLRQTSEIAAYWHRTARETPPPPPPPTAAELAAAARAEAERQRAEQRRREAEYERRAWGGRPPSERLRAIGGRAAQLARLDRELVDAVAGLDPRDQRAIAAWAAATACAAARLTDLDWVAAALAALAAGAALPPPFDEPAQAWARMFPGPSTVTITRITTGEPAPTVLAPEAAAVDAVLAAGEADPARAALYALDAASGARPDRGAYLAEVRRAWPQLG